MAKFIGGTAGTPPFAIATAPPTGFPAQTSKFNQPLQVYRVGSAFQTNFNPLAYKVPAQTTYYVAPTGLAGNSGLTPALPTNLVTALAKSDVGTIIFASGEYDRSNSFGGNITKPLNLIGNGPGVLITGWNIPSGLTWSSQAGAIYKCTRSAVIQCIDKGVAKTSWGDWPCLTLASSLGAMVAGSWFTDNVTTYVWTSDSRSLIGDTGIRLGISVTGLGFQIVGDIDVYIESINFEGACQTSTNQVLASYVDDTHIPRVVNNNCTFKYARNNGVGTISGYMASYGCTASSNFNDGFNYHKNVAGVVVGSALEVNCLSYRNGQDNQDASGNSNGSTSHDGVNVIRVNTLTNHNRGPEIIDVLGAQSWNLGCQVANSVAPSAIHGYDCNDTNGQMFLDTCSSSGNTYAITANIAQVFIHNFTSNDTNISQLTNGSTITAY